jgi:hypothetical protein
MAEQQTKPELKINCRVMTVVGGGYQLIFEVAATQECVGELRLGVLDERYLPTISQLFAHWVNKKRGKLVLPVTIHGIIKGAQPPRH